MKQVNTSSGKGNQTEHIICLLEEQLAHSNQQNKDLAKQIEALTEQVRQLTKLLYGSKTEKARYQSADGQASLFDDDSSFSLPEPTEEQSQQTATYTVVRKIRTKKRNDSLREDIETEMIQHHPKNTICNCCHNQMVEIGSTIAREEAAFIPAKMMRVQHIEHAYECKACKRDTLQQAQIKRGQAPKAEIQRSLASPSVLAKLIYDKFIQYLPLYRQVKEWDRYGLETNDKNLSNWVIRAATDWLLPVYEHMKEEMMAKSILHVDETYAQIINRSDGKTGQTNAYNWVYRSVPSQGPTIILFDSALSRARTVLDNFTQDFKGTIICDGYSAYGKLKDVTFSNCWAHVRRYWLKADSKSRKKRQKHSKPIVREFLRWVETSPFFGKNALAKAAEYTLNRVEGLTAFLDDGRIEIDNNPAENAIRANVIGRKNWLFSVSKAGAQANAICLSLAETAKANGIDFYEYIKKLFLDLPNLDIHQNTFALDQYLPWSKKIKETCSVTT